MGGKRIIRPFKMLDAGDMSGDVYSTIVNVEYMDSIGIQAVYSGAPVGDLKVQVSNDYDPKTNVSGATWSTLDSLTDSISASGESTFNLQQLPFAYIRLFWDFTSGTGSIDATLTAKRLGG